MNGARTFAGWEDQLTVLAQQREDLSSAAWEYAGESRSPFLGETKPGPPPPDTTDWDAAIGVDWRVAYGHYEERGGMGTTRSVAV